MEGNAITILLNDQVVDTTPAFEDFVETYKTCFDSFDYENDIIELRNEGYHYARIAIYLTQQQQFLRHTTP